MIIRPAKASDIPKLKALHASSLAKYDLPNLDDVNLITALIVVDEADEPKVLLLARRTAEISVVLDHDWESPAWRLLALKELVKEMHNQLVAQGFDDAYAFVGPDVPKSYVRRLMDMGCRLMDWTCIHILRGEV